MVCGSSVGLGFACASALAKSRVKVTINGRNQQTLLAAAEQILGGLNRGVQIAVIDIGTERGQDVVLAKYLKSDILINNNGGPPFVEFESLSRSDLEKVLK